jgi:hypothetical protein
VQILVGFYHLRMVEQKISVIFLLVVMYQGQLLLELKKVE